MIILGIDPGDTGASVWLDAEANEILGCMDHNTWCKAPQPDERLHYLLSICSVPDIIVVEQQHARASHYTDPTTGQRKVVQGIASTWTYAEHYGILKGCLRQYRKPMYFPDPGVWKGSMHLGDKTKKHLSLELARKLWPGSVELFKRKMDHGRAEAALLAEYGRRYLKLPDQSIRKRVL